VKVGIHAVGRLKSGPERDLAERYLDRFARSGAPLSLQFSGTVEHAESRAQSAAERKRDEAARLQAQFPAGATVILLDERGRNRTSQDFAERLAALRDGGCQQLAFVIGGPDGLDPGLDAEERLCLGAATWPHQLVRILLAEQLYRATTILSGHPYHRA
jgi:23S rRNA (pseudouridine1915-N3)-methyltransferase